MASQSRSQDDDETAYVPRWRSLSDPGATGPDEARKIELAQRMPIPHRSWEEMEAAGIDPASTTTWRPAIFSKRATPMPAKRIGTLSPSPASARPDPIHPARLTVPPPSSPVSVTLAEWFAQMANAATTGVNGVKNALRPPDGAAVNPSPSQRGTNAPSNPDGSPGLRMRGEARHRRDTPPPIAAISRRYSDEQILRHRETTLLHGWQDGDPRCRGCHAYDVRPQAWPEHECMNWLCLNCQNWLYSVARHHTPGDRLVIFRRIQDILRDPRRSIDMTRR